MKIGKIGIFLRSWDETRHFGQLEAVDRFSQTAGAQCQQSGSNPRFSFFGSAETGQLANSYSLLAI